MCSFAANASCPCLGSLHILLLHSPPRPLPYHGRRRLCYSCRFLYRVALDKLDNCISAIWRFASFIGRVVFVKCVHNVCHSLPTLQFCNNLCMYPLTPEHEILLLQGDRSSSTCCRFQSLSFTLMKIATSSITSSVFLSDSRVLQLSGSMTRRSTTIGDVALTIQQLEINATINNSVVQTHLSFIAASSSPVSPLPSSPVMALTEHGGGGRVSLVSDTDGSTAWTLPASNRSDILSFHLCSRRFLAPANFPYFSPTHRRLHQAFYIDADGDLHPVHIFSNWLVGQGLSSMAGGGSSSSRNNSSKLLIAEISSVDVFEHRGRLFCNVQQPQLLSVIQPARTSSALHILSPPSPSNRHLGIVSAPQLVLSHSDATM